MGSSELEYLADDKKEITMVDRNKSKDFLLGAFIGVVAGASAALLLVPRPGRKHMADLTTEYSGKALSVAQSFAGEVKEWAETVKEAAIKARIQANHHKGDIEYKHKIEEVEEWAQKAEQLAENVSKEILELSKSINHMANNIQGNGSGSSHAVEDVVEWALIGIDLWKKMK